MKDRNDTDKEEASGQGDKLWLSSQIQSMKLDFFRWLEKETETAVKENRDFTPEFFLLVRDFLSRTTISEDVSSCLYRWLEQMERDPWQEVASDRPGYKCFVRIDFKNSIVRTKWQSFIFDQGRIQSHHDFDPISKLGHTLGKYRLRGSEETAVERPKRY